MQVGDDEQIINYEWPNNNSKFCYTIPLFIAVGYVHKYQTPLCPFQKQKKLIIWMISSFYIIIIYNFGG